MKLRRRIGGRKQLLHAVPDEQRNVLPVVKTDAPEVLFFQTEPEGADKMQFRPGGDGQTTSCTGVVRDLGVVEHDAKHSRKGEESDSGTDPSTIKVCRIDNDTYLLTLRESAEIFQLSALQKGNGYLAVRQRSAVGGRSDLM